MNVDSEPVSVWLLIGMLPVGGAEKTLLDLADALDSDQYDVTVWTIKHEGDLVSEVSENVDYRTLDAAGKWDLRAISEFLVAVQSNAPEIVQSFLFFDNVLARSTALLPVDTRVITGVRSVPNDRSRIRTMVDRLTIGLADQIVSNSQSGAKYTADLGADPNLIEVIPNGREIEEYRTGDASNQLAKELAVDPAKPVVGTVGRLLERKGHYDLLEAWPLITDSYPGTQLLFVGDGPERSGLKKRAAALDCSESIIFAGERDDIPAVLDLMDIFAFPSHFEGMPGAVIEAMAAGLPIVATPVDGNSDLLMHEETGLFIDPESPPDLAAGIERVLSDAELAGSLGSAAQSEAMEKYTIEAMVSNFESTYSLVLNHN